MQTRQLTLSDLPLEVELRQRTATVKLKGTRETTQSFRLREVDDLTDRMAASEILDEARASSSKPLLVYFKNASPTAMKSLREGRVSFLGAEGSCFLFAPPLFVDLRVPPSTLPFQPLTPPTNADARNPFGRTGSRVLRWLLLHPRSDFSMHTLAERTALSQAHVSRVVRALSDEAWIDLKPDPRDQRFRRVRIRRPRDALGAWRRDWDRRRIPTQSWNIRSDSVEATIGKLKVARGRQPELRWAIGGLAGASLVKRAVEPTNTLLWVSRAHLDGLVDVLAPARSARAHPQLRVVTAPDDFIFDLAQRRAGVAVADHVQLWLDCSGEGERALRAADAIADEMGW